MRRRRGIWVGWVKKVRPEFFTRFCPFSHCCQYSVQNCENIVSLSIFGPSKFPLVPNKRHILFESTALPMCNQFYFLIHTTASCSASSHGQSSSSAALEQTHLSMNTLTQSVSKAAVSPVIFPIHLL